MGFFLLCLHPVRLQEFVSALVSIDFSLNEDGTLKKLIVKLMIMKTWKKLSSFLKLMSNFEAFGSPKGHN